PQNRTRKSGGGCLSREFTRFIELFLLVRHDVKGGDWPIDSLEIKLLDRFRFESLFQPAHSFLVSKNLSAFRLGAQSRRQVWQVAHRTVIHSAFKAHSSKGRIAGGDADAQVQIVALFSP